jgi:DNA-binding CsgD family transcriptional regulator
MLNDQFTSVLAAGSVEDFREQVLKFSKWLGFDLVSAMVVVDRPMGSPEFHSIDNAPEAYRQSVENPEGGRRDPVLQHCKRYSTPIIWNQLTYLKEGLVDKWEQQAPFGYRVGVGLALHFPGGRHFVLGVDRDQPLPTEPSERCRLVADLCLFAAFVQEAAMDVLLPVGAWESDVLPRLSARELEVLQWTAEGKTAWEIGRILGSSEQTVTRHAVSAARKLGCVNKVQAVAKALRLGFLN